MSRPGKLTRDGTTVLPNVAWCDGFFCKFAGLMFRKQLEDGEGLLMVEGKPSRSGTSIHMLFMFIPLTVVWLDENLIVVDKIVAKPWRLAYVPKQAAKFTLETSTDYYDSFNLGDALVFEPN